MLDEAGEGCLEVAVDDLFVLDDGAFEMFDGVDLMVRVKDFVELEDTDLVVCGELCLVLVEDPVILEDDDSDKVVRMLVGIFFVLVKDFVELDGRLVMLVEIFSMLVEDILGLDNDDFVKIFFVLVVVLFVLVEGLAVLVEDFLVLVRVFLVVAGILCVVVELDFP